MYTTIVLKTDTVLIDWAAEKFRGMRPEVHYKAGEVIQARIDSEGTAGTVYTVFHVGLGGHIYSNSRLVRSDGQVFRKYKAYDLHTRIVVDMIPVL